MALLPVRAQVRQALPPVQAARQWAQAWDWSALLPVRQALLPVQAQARLALLPVQAQD